MKIVKRAIVMGNGAAIYIPKEYSGRQVVVILPEETADLKKRIIEKLADYMENIVGVYLFGSYARGESHLLSDIDVLVITREEDKKLKNLFDGIDIRVVTLENIKKSIENLPAITLPMLKEAKTILNPVLLEELRNSKVNYRKFSWNFGDIKRILKIIESFIQIDEEEIDISHIYSLVMRARICFMIDGLLNNKGFSNKGVQNEMIKRGLEEKKYKEYYEVYQKVREGESLCGKINKKEITSFINIIKKYSSEMENESKKKIGKRN